MEKKERDLLLIMYLLPFCGYLIPFGNVIGPMILWMMKKEESPMLDEAGREVLNFQITIFLMYFIAGILCFVLIGYLLLPVVFLIHVIYTIISIVEASKGRVYRFGMAIKLF